jgi:hypothetical protein
MAENSQIVTIGVNFSSMADQTIVSAVASQEVLLVGMGLLVNGATTLTFKNQLAGTGFGPWVVSAAQLLVLDDVDITKYPPLATFPAGTGLVITNSAAIQVSGYIRYIQA